MEIADKASSGLFKIRSQIKSSKVDIDKNFNKSLRLYKKDDFLDST
jgi:hypothetical protein